jgi:hypothetical protein
MNKKSKKPNNKKSKMVDAYNGVLRRLDCWNGSLNDQAVTVFCFKESDYIMSIMSTYGTVNPVGKLKRRVFPLGAVDGTQEACTFQYTEVFHNHYQYRHVVDDNNNNRMQPISIEETWKTSYWPN